jgi:hypothetical protein
MNEPSIKPRPARTPSRTKPKKSGVIIPIIVCIGIVALIIGGIIWYNQSERDRQRDAAMMRFMGN